MAVVLVGCGGVVPSTVPSGSRSVASSPSTEASPSPATIGAIEPFGSLRMTRASHSANVLPDGRILVAGGCIEDLCEGITAETEILDPRTGRSVPGPAMTEPRVGHVVVPLPGGRLLSSAAGVPAASHRRPSCSIRRRARSPRARRWPSGAPTRRPCCSGTAPCCCWGLGWTWPVASAELYDPVANTFRPTGALSTARAGQSSEILPDGRVLVAGGNAGTDGGQRFRGPRHGRDLRPRRAPPGRPTGVMTIRRHKHAAVGPRGRPRADPSAAPTSATAGASIERAELFDPATGSFTATAPMGSPRYKIQDAVAPARRRTVLVAGGAERGELFDPATGRLLAGRRRRGSRLELRGRVPPAGRLGARQRRLRRHDHPDRLGGALRPVRARARALAPGPDVLIGTRHRARAARQGRRLWWTDRAFGDLVGDQPAKLLEPVRSELLAQDGEVGHGSPFGKAGSRWCEWTMAGACATATLVGAARAARRRSPGDGSPMDAFCPRCGTARVAGIPVLRRCGLDLGACTTDRAARAAERREPPQPREHRATVTRSVSLGQSGRRLWRGRTLVAGFAIRLGWPRWGRSGPSAQGHRSRQAPRVRRHLSPPPCVPRRPPRRPRRRRALPLRTLRRRERPSGPRLFGSSTATRS